MSQKGMEANDISPETDQTDETQYSVQNVGVVDLQDDIHVCRRCNLEFDSIQKYLEHKIKHDNFRVKYMRSEVDRRMVMPKLIQKVTRKTFQGVSGGEPLPQEEEKENNESKKKGRKSRKRANEIHDQDLVITEKPVYSCEKCHKKFNREATLRRHIQYDHNEDDLDDDDDDINLDDDRDRDYKPTPIEIQEEEIKDQQYDEEAAEMDSLDQVIMAAEMMEKAEGSDMGAQTVSITTGSGQIIRAIISKDLTRNQTALRAAGAQQDEFLVTSPAKRQKLSEEEKALRKFVCSVCGNKFKDANVLKAHMVTHSSTRQYVCTYEHCPYSFKTKGSLKRHLRRHTGERPYPCELCGRKFAESGALTRHLKSRTPCTSKSDNDLPRYGKKWTYTPNIPAVTMTKKVISKRNEEGSEQQNNIAEITEDSMIQDVSEVTLPVDDSASKVQFSNMTSVVEALEETLQEEEAEEIYDIGHEDGIEIVIEGADDIISDDTIGQFVQTETDINGAVANVCRVCGEDFSSLEALKIHLRSHLADQTCRCWLCHFNTESREEFENHMYIHHHVQVKNSEPILDLMSLEPDIKDTLGENKDKDKNYSYKDAQIAVKQLLEISGESSVQQVAAVGNRPLYKCPICVRKFRGSNYLKLHMRNHIGLRPHKCMECDKSFITKDTLNKHLSSHAQDRNFKCGECGKLFKRLSHVREHLKIHSGLRPYPCTICGKKFKTNNAMKVHLRTHSDILPYECSYCHRRFREKGSVLRHTRMHTGEKPYECRYCGRCFAEHGTLNRHLKAKVSCTKQLQELRDQPETDTDLSVLAEFSSVVADTQQYMIPDGEVDSTQIQESFVQQDSLLQSDSELQLDPTNQDTEYVLVQEGDEEHIQNLEIVTNEEGESLIEGVQIAEEYYVISGADGTEMKLMDGKTGQVVAVVPVSAGDNDNEIQTITLTHDNELSTEMEEVAAETAVLLETVESNEGVVDGVVEKTEEMQDIEQPIENQE